MDHARSDALRLAQCYVDNRHSYAIPPYSVDIIGNLTLTSRFYLVLPVVVVSIIVVVVVVFVSIIVFWCSCFFLCRRMILTTKLGWRHRCSSEA